jgi:hypothetical protein
MPKNPTSGIVPFPGTPTTTNKEFLEFIFGDQWSQVLVTSFTRDPSDPTAPRQDWNAWPAGDVIFNKHFDQGNTYFCPSLLVPGTRDRQLENFSALHVIVIDDIGTKVTMLDVVNLLRTKPTYIIETSPGNQQAGWKIEPEKDLAWVKGMLTQLDRQLGGRADNLTNPIAWRRLPVGFNTKAALVSPTRPKGWPVRLSRGYPGPMIRGLDWPTDIEPMIGIITRMTTIERGLGDGLRPDDLVLGQDPVYRALEAGGYILGEKITSDKFWAATIKCPWVSEHGPTRPLTGAEYVPAIPGQRGWFHCFHCERRGQAEFREQLDVVLRQEGARIVASFEFDPVDPAKLAFANAKMSPGEAVDLWSGRSPPVWPGEVFPAVLEDALADLSGPAGVDPGALGAALMTAFSGAADKRSLLNPYAGAHWSVPPILWLMLIAEPGLKKTAILSYVLSTLRRRNNERMRRHAGEMRLWRSLPAPQRNQQPEPTVQALLAEDTTIERVQEWMSENPRGLLYVRDELAGLFEFGRYQTGSGAAERTSYLEAYEGGPVVVGRMTRTTIIDNCAMSLLGGIQPQRLRDFKGLADDGLLPRFGTILVPDSRAGLGKIIKLPDMRAIETTIERLLLQGPGLYHTDAGGEALISGTEDLGRELVQHPDIGSGYRAFLRKLHGTHARTALLLHMIDGGRDDLIPEDTVLRAMNYALFLREHAAVFYAELGGSADYIAKAIASYLLRHPKPRVTAGQLRRDVAACRPLRTLKELQDATFLLVIGNWLRPESTYPNNSAWLVNPGLGDQFAARKLEEQRRVEATKIAMNQLGKHRPARKTPEHDKND